MFECSIVVENWAGLGPLKRQLKQLLENKNAQLVARIFMWASGTFFICPNVILDATLAEFSLATIALFRPKKYHLTNFTGKLGSHGLASAVSGIKRVPAKIKICISDPFDLLLVVWLVDAIFRSYGLCPFDHMISLTKLIL